MSTLTTQSTNMSTGEVMQNGTVKSVRVGRVHFHAFRADEDSAPELRKIDFASVNRAKKESRLIGGAGLVRAFKSNPGEIEVKRLLGVAP